MFCIGENCQTFLTAKDTWMVASMQEFNYWTIKKMNVKNTTSINGLKQH